MSNIRVLYRGDCLNILNNYIEPESVDLIYLDPPFNSKEQYNLPFRSQEKTHEPVAAFVDKWVWKEFTDEHGDSDNTQLERLRKHPRLSGLASIIDLARESDTPSASMAAYVLNMAYRLDAARRVLKETGSIFLHCDPTANYYLRFAMDIIFGRDNYRNEIIWHYTGGGRSKTYFSRKHDTILYYSKSNKWTFNVDEIWIPYKETSGYTKGGITSSTGKRYMPHPDGTPVDDVWDIPIINPLSKERLGYPTQKPLKLLERIIKASSKEGDLILDPFCGCGTAAHAAENLFRSWIGIDISRFAVSLIRHRLANNFSNLAEVGIKTFGLPENVADARELAGADPFEFQKWVCGRIGVNQLGQRLGARGPDGGIDGVIELDIIGDYNHKTGKATVERVTGIVQVKGGNVSADSVRALETVVRRSGSIFGIMVCFEDQMRTVNNQRSKDTWSDVSGVYPFIQGFSIEDLLARKKPSLPPLYGLHSRGRLT
ncbi:MAG: DNA methyltransferase [Chloroflexi bacterium]|nr:DNA methyltransferase [Chloroflexota bacterium]MCY4248327.1 DNA methyltransferase [Chloroflexota bacterium]